MGRVSGAPVNVYTGLGDLAYGGAGTPTGYRNRLTAADGATDYPAGHLIFGAGGSAALMDGDPNTTKDSANVPGDHAYALDLIVPRRIGRLRLNHGSPGSWATAWKLQSSSDGAAWVDRYVSAAGVDGDTGYLDLPTPISARYWRLWAATLTPADSWRLKDLQLLEVTTVGAGNPTRLAPPAERRVLAYEPSGGVPEWQARGAAIADLGATVGEANNAASATLMATKAEHDATRATVNSLIARLEGAGILAP